MGSLYVFGTMGWGVGLVVPAVGVFVVLLQLFLDRLYLFGRDCHRMVRELILYIRASEPVLRCEN